MRLCARKLLDCLCVWRFFLSALLELIEVRQDLLGFCPDHLFFILWIFWRIFLTFVKLGLNFSSLEQFWLLPFSTGRVDSFLCPVGYCIEIHLFWMSMRCNFSWIYLLLKEIGTTTHQRIVPHSQRAEPWSFFLLRPLSQHWYRDWLWTLLQVG